MTPVHHNLTITLVPGTLRSPPFPSLARGVCSPVMIRYVISTDQARRKRRVKCQVARNRTYDRLWAARRPEILITSHQKAPPVPIAKNKSIMTVKKETTRCHTQIYYQPATAKPKNHQTNPFVGGKPPSLPRSKVAREPCAPARTVPTLMSGAQGS